MIIGGVYKHPKHEVKGFANNHKMPLLDKISNENEDIITIGDSNIINSNDDKNTSNFLDAMLSHYFLSFTTTPTRTTRNTKTLNDNIFITNLLMILCLEI